MEEEMVGYRSFRVMHAGVFYFPKSQLTLVDHGANNWKTLWYEIYRIGPHEGEWMIYYGEEVLGHSYIRFVHNRDDAFAIARNWLERWEV